MPLEPATRGDAAARTDDSLAPLSRRQRRAPQPARRPRAARSHARVSLHRNGLADVRHFDAFADVVLHARGVGHRFPGGTMDSNQVWLEVRAFDASGALIGKSGVAAPDGSLPADTHLVRAQPVDGDGRPLQRRDPQHMRGVAFDASLSPSDPAAVRFRLPPTRRAWRRVCGIENFPPPTHAAPAPSSTPAQNSAASMCRRWKWRTPS